jgi:hypothetical protein
MKVPEGLTGVARNIPMAGRRTREGLTRTTERHGVPTLPLFLAARNLLHGACLLGVACMEEEIHGRFDLSNWLDRHRDGYLVVLWPSLGRK